ncbi:sensor histidine kinase [Flavobacterium sp.]|uniref:tetratricopeptide repeat-containing sensor histidine kinase n=1 Tax=Flavobacterium sp. TaxID=239 RepID=UPI002B4B1E07|nr:sensor histidine kinase [Flavobacterium sp.]HLP65581.1 sensor histidine kinase [Flavobacterium sp.]
MKRYLLLLLLSFSLLAQNSDGMSCRAINDKAMEIYLSQPDEALSLLKKAEKKALESNDDELIALTLNNRAIIIRINGKFLESKKLSLSVLNKAKEELTKASIYNNIGACNRSLGLYKESISYYLKALKVYEAKKDIKRQATVDNNIGMVFSSLEQFDKAKTYHKKSMQLFIQINDKKGLSESYNNLAIALANQDSLAQSMVYFRKSLKIEEVLKDQKGIAESLNNVGTVHYYLGVNDSALYYFEKSAEIERQLKNFSGASESYNSIAQVYLEMKQYPKAKKFIDSAYALSQKTKVVDVTLTALDNYKIYYEGIGDFAEANKKMTEFYKLKDSVKEVAKIKDINELETKYQTAKKEKLIAEKEAESKRKSTWIIVISILSLFSILIGFLIYRQQKLKNKQQEQEFQLKTAIAQIETQNQLQEQRLAISRDLHDNIGAQLTFVISSVDNLKYGNQISDNRVVNQLTKISDFTKSTIIELRDTIWAMNNNEFSFDDLRSRIFNFIEKAKSAKEDIVFKFNVDETLKEMKFSSIIGINLYRTIQEAVNNAVKYSEAKEIEVSVNRQNETVIIEVKDNGKGFDMETVDFGNGLNNMRKRIEEIGGKITISSNSKGTVIEIVI